MNSPKIIQQTNNECNSKVEYYANAKYENPLKNSEKIACVCQRLMYPIMEKKTLTCQLFLKTPFGFQIFTLKIVTKTVF